MLLRSRVVVLGERGCERCKDVETGKVMTGTVAAGVISLRVLVRDFVLVTGLSRMTIVRDKEED